MELVPCQWEVPTLEVLISMEVLHIIHWLSPLLTLTAKTSIEKKWKEISIW